MTVQQNTEVANLNIDGTMAFMGESSTSKSLENLLCKGLWTCR
jgi:hypothetical protein